MYKKFVNKIIIFILMMTFIVISFNFIIDPYNITKYNFLDIEHKLIKDNRSFKINQIKSFDSIDNLILGSSRSESLNPKLLDEYLGGFTYSFSIGGANVEDYLGILLYLKKVNKLPKNILLCLDFGAFREDLQVPGGFLKIPEINFLNNQKDENLPYKLFSIDSIMASVKTLKYHLKNIKPDSYINKQGFLVRNNTNIYDNLKEINKLANLYYEFSYKKGNLNISSHRLEYLKQIIEITENNNIDLKIMLTPVHNILYNKIVSNKNLFEKLTDFKMQLKNIHEYNDYMIDSIENRNDLYFEDAVHYTEEYGNLLVTDIIKGK